MKRNSIYKKALVLAAVLALALILLVGCGQTTSGDSNLNQFVKPDTGSQQQTETVKTALSGNAARQLLLTSIINAKTVEPNSRYITFSFAPYVYVEKEGKTDKYTVKVKGSIDTLGGRDDKQYPVNESVMTFEVLKESADLTTVVLGIYAKGGDMYIDFNDYETGKAVHRYYVSDSDIAYVVGLFKDILNQLKIEEVLTDYDLGSLINDAGIKKLISDILGTKSDDKLTLFNIMLSLISESGSYSVTNADGSVDLVMPTKLNAIFGKDENNNPSFLLTQVGNVVNNLLGKQSDIIKGVVNFLVGDILSGKKTLNTAFVANISNNRFQKLALNVVSTKGGVDKTMELGVGGLSKSADFANEVKNSMPELVKADRKNYSFTTLSADLNINLDIAKQEYSIENIDGAVGGAIAKALEGITGTEIYKKSDAIQILEPLQISLHLKLRAEINLKDNKKTRAVIELNGKDKKGNDRTYLGLYYIGADNALYADMSGLGGGKAMIPDVNLNQILKDLIAAKIPEIPSIMEIIGGKGSGAASGDVINAGLIEAVQTAMDNGELVVTHYGLASGDEDSAAVEETASLDIMALIGCLNIVKGDSTPLTVESISASLTKDVIAGLMGKLGVKLPIDKLDLKIYQTREDYPHGEEGWKIDVAVNMATEERGQILGANVGLFLNYGNPDPSLDGYLEGKEFKSAEEGGEYINAGKLTYKDGEFDFDLWVSIGLELELEFNIRENSVIDLSALGKLLYNLALKVQSPDGVNAKFNLKINANANVMALVNAIKNGADVATILGAIDARIDITTGEGQNAKTAVLLLEDGMLYLNSSDGEFRNYKINILEALGGNFKLFGKDVSGTGSALASGEGDTTEGEGGDAPATEEKAKFDIVGLLLANINCISVNRDRLEVAIADTLITALLNGLGVDTEIVKGLNFSSKDTAISLEYDGLNLSKLWLKANVGIQQGDNAALGLGLGLGHIVLTAGKRNLAALGERNILEDEYQDLLNGGNVYLGLGAEIDVALDDETYVLEDLLGALVANFALGTTIDIKDEIKGGLTFNIVADIDISSKPDQNDSRILIEIRKKSNKKVFLGLYYDQKTTTLYLKTDDGTIIQPVALKFDLIGLLEGLINKGDGTASADIDLSELNPVILLSNKGLQIQVMTGVMKLLVGVLVGDMNDYIEYNAGATSYKYYAYDANTDYTILQNAYPLANPVGQKDLYQRNVDKYVYENGEFTLNNDYVGNDFFVKAKEGSFFYVLKDNATGIDEKYFEKNADGTLKEFANSGRKFTLIDASNKDIYASAPKYYQSEFKRADTLMFDMDKDTIAYAGTFVSALQGYVAKYVYDSIKKQFTLNNSYTGDEFYVKAKEGNFFYVLKEQATAQGIDKQLFEKNADDTVKEFVLVDGTFTLIDASNLDTYASAPKYVGMRYKLVSTLSVETDKNSIEFIPAFIAAYNKTSGLTTYVKVDASKQEVALYEVFTQGYTMKDVFDENGKPTGETKRMELKLPELGASIVIGQIKDGDVSVVEGGTKFSGIGIGIFIMRNGQSDPHGVHYVKIAADETYTGKRYNLVDGTYQEAADGEYKQVANTAANVAIKLGNIQLSEKTFKENYGITLEQFIDGLQNENLPQADATNIADLTVYVNVEAGIEIGAIKTAAGGDTWAIGGLLSGIVKGNEKVPSALADFLKSLLIKFNVQDEFKDVIGLRIAGNVNIGALLSGDTKDTMQIVKALLTKSDLAVELTDGYPWEAKKTVVGLYVTEGTIYINIDGEKTIKDTKLKIGVDKVLGMVGGASTGALASADLGVEGILSIVNNIVKEISIYRNDEASGMTISLSKNMLGAILKLVADIDGVDLKLNETNSFIELNTKVTDKKPYLLKLSVGIDPLVLGIALGGLKIGLAANSNVLKNLNKTDYKGLSEIETMALDVEIGVDLGLKQGEFPIGKLVSGILQATGTDLEFPLNLDIQSELDLDLRVRLAGNLNLKEFGKSDLMLQVRNAAPGKEKTILGLYFTSENDVPCLYVETQFFSQSAPVRSKVENFDLLGSLLGKTVSGVVEYLGGKVEGTGAALASDDGSTPNEAEILLELASKSIQVKIAEETVKGLLEALVGDKVGDDIIEIINGLGLSAEVAVNLKDADKPLLSVVATCSYLDLGILVNKVNLSTQKQDIFGTTLSGNTWTKTEDTTKSALGVQFGVELSYDISNGKHSLDAILSNVASAAAFEKDATMATVGSILKAVSLDAIIKNTHGSIGIDVVLNVKSEKMTEYLVPAGQALYELIMGKLGAEYTAGEEKYDPLTLLNMVEALIKINLNGNPVFVSLKDGYVYVSLSAVGGDNFKASLKNIIDQIKKTTGSGSSALATGEGDGEDKKDDKKTDYVLVNKILQNLLASASISDTGLDLALAPDLMNVLLENVVAKLLGDTFGFSDDVKAMFTLSSPYAKLSDGKTSVDDVLYTEKVEERYVRYNAAFESQQGSEQYFFDAEAKVYRKLYKADAVDATKYVVYTGGEVQTLYYSSNADEYVALTAEQAAAARFVKYTHTSYLAVYDSADKATRNVVQASKFVAAPTKVYDANGNPVAEDNLFVKVKHSGIGWTKDNGISIDLVFDNPNTTKTPDFSIGLGLDATLVLQGEAIEVIPYFVKKAGATALDNQEVKGYFKEGTAFVEIPASEVYTGTRYDKDGKVDENGKFRKELVEGTEAEHDLVLIGNIFPEVSETVGDEKIYLSMELGLTLSGTKGTNDSILDFVADIIDVSNRTGNIEYYPILEKENYEGQKYSASGALKFKLDENGEFKRGAYYLAEKEFVGTKFVKNTDGTFTVADNGAYKFVGDDSAKTYYPIVDGETYTGKKYKEDGNGFVTDDAGTFKAGKYVVTGRDYTGTKFRLDDRTKDKVDEEKEYLLYDGAVVLFKQGNYYEIDKDELATFKGVRFEFDSVNKVATVNDSGKYQFVAEEGAYYPVLENDGYTGKLYRVSEASTPDNTIYIEDVIYKFTPAFTGKDLRDLNALAKLLVSIGEFEAEARIKVTVGANVAELVKALSNTANIDIAELLKHVELAIESLDSRGTVKGGIYLYNSTLYIKYINTSRGIFSMPVSELFGAIASASAEERMPYDAAMLQLWVGEFIKLNGVYTTGIAVQATTSLVETLLETLLGFDKGTISLAAFGAVGVEVTIVTASPIFPENADGEVYVKKAYEFVEITDANYDGEKFIKLDDTYVEAKDGKYKAVYVTEYVKLKDGEVYEGVTYNLVDGAYVPAAEGTVGEYKAVEKIKYVLIADGEEYKGIRFNRVYGEYVFVEKAPDGAKLYQRVKLEDAAVEYKNVNALPEGWLLSECEGYDSAYAKALTTRYTKVTEYVQADDGKYKAVYETEYVKLKDGEVYEGVTYNLVDGAYVPAAEGTVGEYKAVEKIKYVLIGEGETVEAKDRYTKVDTYEELKFGFDFNSFGIGIGLKIGHVGFNLNIGKIDIGLIDGTQSIVPDEVKNATVAQETVIDLSLEVNLGLEFMDKNTNATTGFDIGKFVDGLGVLTGVTLGEGWLKLTVPEGGAEVRLSLRVALALNLTNVDHSVASIEIVGQIFENGVNISANGGKILIGVYYKDGNVLLKLDGLGFDNIRISGLRLSDLLGGSNGVEILKKLLGGSGSSSALASEVNFTVVGNDEFGSPAAALILDSNRIAVEVGSLFIEKLLGIAALGLDENTQKLLGGLDLKALVEVNFGEKFVTAEKDYTGTKYALDIETNKYYIDNENGTFKRESNISLKLNAEAAELLGINVAVENIKIGNTGVEEKVKAIDINDYVEFIEILFGTEKDENGNEIVDANGKPKKKIVGFEPKLEALTLSLDIDLGAMFTNGMAMGRSILDSEGKTVLTNVSSVGAIGNGNMGIRASVKLEIAFAALLNKLQQGFDSSDIFAAIEQALPLVKAQISIYAQSDGDELIGIYVADGNVYLMLDGLGMPNIKVTGEFLMDIIRAATGSGTALSSDEATASVETSQIIDIVKQIVDGISVGGKALKVAFQNDYFAKLVDAVLSIVLNKKDFRYYQDVLPEVPTDVAFSGLTINLAGIEDKYEPIYRKDGKYYTDAGCTSQYYGMVFFKNTVTNHIELFSEKEYVKQFGEVNETTEFYRSIRNGLVELDLVAYSTHLKLAVNMPKLGAQKNIISSPEVAGVAFTEADEVTGVALGLKGQVKIDKQPGIALANILSGVVGDLETKLVIEEDIDIRFAIEAAVGIKYSLKDKNFALNAVDLRISLTRVDATLGNVPLAVLTYISSEGTLYVDVSHFFQKQNAGNNKNLGMLKITGVNVLDLINGLITGEGSATSVALGSSDAWVEDEQQPYTYVYYEANAINSAAPAKFVHVAQLNEKDEPRMVYRNYTGAISADYKTESGDKLYVRDRSNKVTGYTLLSAENAEKFSHKAKYTYEQAMTYTKLTDLYVKVGEDYVLAAGDADVTATVLYQRVISNYVKIADGETVNAEDRYEQNADGTYTQNANGTFKAVYKFVKVSDGSAWYIEEYNSETCKYDYNVYDPANPNHNAPKLYHYDETEKKYVEGAGEGGAKSYVKVPVYSISAVWADLRNYGIADNVAGYDVKSNAKVNITGKAMLGLIGGLMGNTGLEDILDALLISIHATKDPFIFGADIGILDVYNDHKLALNVGLNIFGFDFEKREGADNTDGSYLEFLDAENTISFRPANANSYRQFVDVDLNRILSASEIMDVLVDSLDFGKSGKIYLNLSLDADSFAKDTGDNFVPWEKYFAALLGLNENSARVLYQVLFPEDELDGKGNFSIDIAAAIDVKKLLGGLIAGTGLNLEGTEIRITINSDTMLFSEDSRKDGSKIVITAIGEADGILSVFIDNSGYRGKGKHVARLDLNAILGTATSSAAYASANENTGLIPENIFGVLNALLGEVRLGGGKISVVLRENFIGALLNTLVGTDITEQQSLVKGEIYIDLRNLEVGIEMILGDDNYVSEGERDFYIGLRIGGINLTAPDGFDMTEYTFIKKAERANFKNIKQLKLDINFESEWYYDATNKTEGFDISPVVDILETILKKELFPDRLLQVLVKDDKIDAVYATAISAHIDLADFNNMKLSVEIFKSTSEEPVRELKLGVYLDGQSLYVDLSGWGLPKIKLGGLNLGNTINDALLPLLDQYLVGDDNKRGGETAALASSYVGDYDKNHIEYSDFVEAADGKYVLVYTESNSGGYVLVDGKYVKYNAKEHAGATRYARKVEEYDMANTAHQNVTRYNVNKGAFRSSWGKVLFPVAYEEDENGGYVLIDGKYVPYNAEEHAGQKRYKEVSGNKPYISLLLANNRFGFGINADLINSLLETILGALNLDIQLPDFGDAVLLFDSRKDLNGDGYADTQLDLAVQVNDNLYFGFRTTNLEITGNSTKVSHAETRYAEVVTSHKDEFVTVYDIEKGEIGLETVALGFNVQIRQNCVDNGQSDFEKYLGVLLKSLLGINNFTLNLPSSGEIGCDIDLRVSLNIANLVKALQGGNVDWWSDIELYLDLKPMGYGSLLTMYKQKGDADVYADLSGLSLFKVKIIGLQSLIGGLVSASATALASGDNEVAIASASGDIAKLTIIPGKVGFTVEIGWGFIEGLLTSLLGDTLHVADGTGELADYKTITIGEGATATVIPLPKMNNDRALSLSINHASAMYNRSLEIDLRLGFNKNDESAVNLKIHNFVLTSGQEKSARYIRFGATAGKINEAGTGNGVLDAINGTNANAFSGLVLSDAKGISLVNILTSVIKGIDPDISISWKKNTNHYYTDSNTESYNSNQYATIELSRTDKGTTHMSGTNVRTYAGKFQARIDNDKGRLIGAWLFNNQLYIDITQTLDIPLAIGALRKMKVADLDILGLLGGLGSASATNAMASDEATTEKSLKDTVSGFVKGIQVNWWNNKSVAGNPVGDKAITTIRVDLNGKGLNNILAKVYYLLYGMYDTNAPAAELFSEEALYQMVYTEGQDVTLKDGTVVKSVNAHGKCVFYLQTFASNMIGEMASILKNMLKPGGSFGDVLREILGRLLPLPKLDEAENGRPSYVEIVIDKNRLASGKGVLKQIALVINKERTENDGSTITAVGNNNDTAEIVINLDNNVTLRSVSAVRDYNTNSTKPNEDSGKTINVANPFDPVELTSAALNSSGLLDRVAADFYGISEYDSKSEKDVDDAYAELGGTPIVWDTSTAILEPGKESEIWGYALNYKVQKVKVKVSNSTGFLRLFGYFKADGTTFVETNKITVDPTKDPKGTDNISAGLPRIIVIMRRDGELQVLSRDYDKDNPGTVNINGTNYTVDGKFNWIDEDTVEEGATVEKLFWYQVGYSSRIQKSIKVKYNNVDIVSGSLPNDDKFGILNGGTAFDFTPENFDIVGNLGLPSIKASETFTKNGDKFSYVGFDGSTYEFTPGTAPTNETELAEWNKHTLGGNGTFTRSFNGKVLQSGTYTYVAAESTAAGLLDSLGGLFGGSGANTDNGKYDLTVTDTGYTGLKEITVKLGTGKTTTVDVIEWNYDDFKYDMRKPQNGASGRIVAVINKYEIKRTTGLVEKTEVVNSKQKIRLDVGITQESLSALADGDLKFNQYEDAFVLSATGDYVLETRDAFIPYDETLHKDQKQYALVDGTYVDDLTLAAADNTARYVEGKVTGYVYDKYADGKSADNRYAINIFDAEELYVKVKHSRITSETQQFHVDDFKFYTDTFTATDTQTPFTMFVVPELGVKTERNITVKALYDVNGAYEQIFDIKVVVTPKVATKVVLLIDNDQVIDRTYLESTAEVTVYYKDGTEKQGLAKDLIRLTDKEIEKIANAKDHLGITYGTASVFKKGRYELIAAGETYDGQRFDLVDGNFVKATDGAYKFVEDETFVQNGVTFEIRVFSKN